MYLLHVYNRRSFEFVMTCLDKGYDLYQKYLDSSLIMKDVGLFQPIKRNQQIQRSKDDKNERMNANKGTIRVINTLNMQHSEGMI